MNGSSGSCRGDVPSPVPLECTILLAGPPGAGKSTFCQQAALHNLSVEKPIIYVTTESFIQGGCNVEGGQARSSLNRWTAIEADGWAVGSEWVPWALSDCPGMPVGVHLSDALPWRGVR